MPKLVAQGLDADQFRVAVSESGPAATTVAWEDVSYSVNGPLGGGPRLEVLKGVSGCARGGRLLAVMGASGSGKTSLLDVLCGRKVSGRGEQLSGRVLMNGRELRERFSYVPQSDVLLNSATVRETLEFAAQLCIPGLRGDDLRQRVWNQS